MNLPYFLLIISYYYLEWSTVCICISATNKTTTTTKTTTTEERSLGLRIEDTPGSYIIKGRDFSIITATQSSIPTRRQVFQRRIAVNEWLLRQSSTTDYGGLQKPAAPKNTVINKQQNDQILRETLQRRLSAGISLIGDNNNSKRSKEGKSDSKQLSNGLNVFQSSHGDLSLPNEEKGPDSHDNSSPRSTAEKGRLRPADQSNGKPENQGNLLLSENSSDSSTKSLNPEPRRRRPQRFNLNAHILPAEAEGSRAEEVGSGRLKSFGISHLRPGNLPHQTTISDKRGGGIPWYVATIDADKFIRHNQTVPAEENPRVIFRQSSLKPPTIDQVIVPPPTLPEPMMDNGNLPYRGRSRNSPFLTALRQKIDQLSEEREQERRTTARSNDSDQKTSLNQNQSIPKTNPESGGQLIATNPNHATIVDPDFQGETSGQIPYQPSGFSLATGPPTNVGDPKQNLARWKAKEAKTDAIQTVSLPHQHRAEIHGISSNGAAARIELGSRSVQPLRIFSRRTDSIQTVPNPSVVTASDSKYLRLTYLTAMDRYEDAAEMEFTIWQFKMGWRVLRNISAGSSYNKITDSRRHGGPQLGDKLPTTVYQIFRSLRNHSVPPNPEAHFWFLFLDLLRTVTPASINRDTLEHQNELSDDTFDAKKATFQTFLFTTTTPKSPPPEDDFIFGLPSVFRNHNFSPLPPETEFEHSLKSSDDPETTTRSKTATKTTTTTKSSIISDHSNSFNPPPTTHPPVPATTKSDSSEAIPPQTDSLYNSKFSSGIGGSRNGIRTISLTATQNDSASTPYTTSLPPLLAVEMNAFGGSDAPTELMTEFSTTTTLPPIYIFEDNSRSPPHQPDTPNDSNQKSSKNGNNSSNTDSVGGRRTVTQQEKPKFLVTGQPNPEFDAEKSNTGFGWSRGRVFDTILIGSTALFALFMFTVFGIILACTRRPKPIIRRHMVTATNGLWSTETGRGGGVFNGGDRFGGGKGLLLMGRPLSSHQQQQPSPPSNVLLPHAASDITLRGPDGGLPRFAETYASDFFHGTEIRSNLSPNGGGGGFCGSVFPRTAAEGSQIMMERSNNNNNNNNNNELFVSSTHHPDVVSLGYNFGFGTMTDPSAQNG